MISTIWSRLFRRYVGGLADVAGRRPYLVLVLALATLLGTWAYARKLELRSDFLELLPRDSPGLKAFEHQLGRVGRGATFIVVVESPDRAANKRFIDDLGSALDEQTRKRATCIESCKDGGCAGGIIAACGPDFISYVERGTKDVHAFFSSTRWLYASLADLQEADTKLDNQIAIRTGLVEDLEGAPSPAVPPPAAAPTSDATPREPAKEAFGMTPYYERWERAGNKYSDFPTGYFANEPGTLMVMRIVSNASGTGGYTGDLFLADMTKRVADMRVKERYHPEMNVGFSGDIPAAAAEKKSTIEEAALASGAAFVLVLAGIIVYFRSAWSMPVIALPALIGVGGAYAFATIAFGYVNTPGAFLGAVILGNGVNYPIVLLARYREFRARGMEPAEARREAVLNAFRAELVGASVASIAYGSLTVTRFRGFSQFGTIGFVGMLLVWLAIIPVLPASIVAVERLQLRLPAFLRDPPMPLRSDGSSGPVMRFVARVTTRRPWVFILLCTAATIVAATKIPGFLRDPWEYNFAKLGSRSSKIAGPGAWSNKADSVFQGKLNIAGTLILADSIEQVPELKAKILALDAADPKGKLIDDIVTIDAFLPGSVEEQVKKLAVLERIRDRLTPRVLASVSEGERRKLEDMRPPEDLQPMRPRDLPPLIRRRFEENDGRVGTLMYVRYAFGVSHSNGRNLLRMSRSTDNVQLGDGTVVQTASRASIFAEMIRSMERDGPLATSLSFIAVAIVVSLATRSRVGTISVLLALCMGVAILVGVAAATDTKLNFFNFIALPITFGIGCEYPFNVFDRTRLLGGDVRAAVARTGGAVGLCSFTTTVGYASMLFADNQALQSFGRLAMAGEIACVAMALLFLPALLHVLYRNRAAPVEDDAR